MFLSRDITGGGGTDTTPSGRGTLSTVLYLPQLLQFFWDYLSRSLSVLLAQNEHTD